MSILWKSIDKINRFLATIISTFPSIAITGQSQAEIQTRVINPLVLESNEYCQDLLNNSGFIHIWSVCNFFRVRRSRLNKNLHIIWHPRWRSTDWC